MSPKETWIVTWFLFLCCFSLRSYLGRRKKWQPSNFFQDHWLQRSPQMRQNRMLGLCMLLLPRPLFYFAYFYVLLSQLKGPECSTHWTCLLLQLCPQIGIFISLWPLVVGSRGVKEVPLVVFAEIEEVRGEPGTRLAPRSCCNLFFLFFSFFFILWGKTLQLASFRRGLNVFWPMCVRVCMILSVCQLAHVSLRPAASSVCVYVWLIPSHWRHCHTFASLRIDHLSYCCCCFDFHQGEPGFLGPQGEPGLPGLPGTKVGTFYFSVLRVLRQFQDNIFVKYFLKTAIHDDVSL